MNLNRPFLGKTAAIALAFGAALATAAQLAPVAPPSRPPPAVDAPRPRPGSGPAGRGPANEGLGQEQSAAIRQIMDSSREETRILSEKLSKARKELERAVQADTFDEQLIRAKALEVGKIEGDMAVLRARTYAKMRPLLKPGPTEQTKQGGSPDDRLRHRPLPGRTEEVLGPRPGNSGGPQPAAATNPLPPGHNPSTNRPPRPASSPAPN